jgi:hypothetical protein
MLAGFKTRGEYARKQVHDKMEKIVELDEELQTHKQTARQWGRPTVEYSIKSFNKRYGFEIHINYNIYES